MPWITRRPQKVASPTPPATSTSLAWARIYLRGSLVVKVVAGASITAVLHLPDGGGTLHGVANDEGNAVVDVDLRDYAKSGGISTQFEIVVDVTAQAATTTRHCATSFYPGGYED